MTPVPTASGLGLSGEGWHMFVLPGKRSTEYSAGLKDGRRCVRAVADRSASLWRRAVHIEAQRLGALEFAWRVDRLLPGADLSVAEREDSPARVMLAFAGDSSRLSARNRMMFDLARVLTGEDPPYATLVYTWSSTAPVGTVIVSGRTDRVRKIVVESGPAQLGRWRDYRRDIAADYRLAFGEEPGALVGVAVMTDADNTQGRAEAWYGDIAFR